MRFSCRFPWRREYPERPGEFRQLFVSALTKPADALGGTRRARAVRQDIQLTPTEYDRWFCSPVHFFHQLPDQDRAAGTDVHAIRRVAETEGRILDRVGTLLWIVTLAALVAAALAVAATFCDDGARTASGNRRDEGARREQRASERDFSCRASAAGDCGRHHRVCCRHSAWRGFWGRACSGVRRRRV